MKRLLKPASEVAAATITVILCCGLGARAVNHWVEGAVLPESEQYRGPQRKQPHRMGTDAPAALSKDGRGLVERNMFCSGCTPEAARPRDTETVVRTSLPLRLIATQVSSEKGYSTATIHNTQTLRQGSYNTGQAIPGGASIVGISEQYVEVLNERSNAVERLVLGGADDVAPAIVAPAKRGREGVRKVSDTEYEVEADLFDAIVASPMSFAKGVRVRPAMKGGQVRGLKLYAIRGSSVWAKLGVENGDVVRAVNGVPLRGLDTALALYGKLRTSANVSVDLERGGNAVSIDYRVR